MGSSMQLFLYFPVSTPAGWSVGTNAAWAELELGLGHDRLHLEVHRLPAGTSDHSSAPLSRAGAPTPPLGAERLGWLRCKEQFSLVQLVFIRHRQWGT